MILDRGNHVLKHIQSEDLQENIATYGDPGLPLDPAIVPAIADLIARHSRPASAP